MDNRSAIAQALILCSRGKCSACLYRGQGIACRKKLQADAAEALTGGLTQRDLLTIWGYLDTMRATYQDKAKAAAAREDATGDKLTADYTRRVGELESLQKKVDAEASAREGE